MVDEIDLSYALIHWERPREGRPSGVPSGQGRFPLLPRPGHRYFLVKRPGNADLPDDRKARAYRGGNELRSRTRAPGQGRAVARFA